MYIKITDLARTPNTAKLINLEHIAAISLEKSTNDVFAVWLSNNSSVSVSRADLERILSCLDRQGLIIK